MTIVDRRLNVPEALAAKAPCVAATSGTITLSGLQTIDGIALFERQRVLVWQQVDPRQNGIYTASTGPWLRPNDSNGTESFIQGTTVWVTTGTLNGGTQYIVTTADDPIVIGTSNLTWAPTKRFPESAGDTLSFMTRADVAAAVIPFGTQLIRVMRWKANYPLAPAYYQPGTSAGPLALQDHAGNWWQLALPAPILDIRWAGAGGGNAADDVAAWTFASGLDSGTGLGVVIKVPAGTVCDLSAGSFVFTLSGTRIVGENNQTSSITFDPAAPAELFTFYDAGNANGVSNSEVSNLRIASSNAVQKTIFALKNTTFVNIDRVNLQGISDPTGQSLGILNQGRNYLTVRDSIINADRPHVMDHNPERALVDNEDVDFVCFERNQLTCLSAGSQIHRISDGTQVTSWSESDSDWALGRYGVLNTDTTAINTSNDWSFKGIRREQEQGANPTMFAILRTGSAPVVRNVKVEGCSTAHQLFNLAGVDRFRHDGTTIFFDGVNIGTADATVSGLGWDDLFCGSNCTVALAGQTLLSGRDRQGGTELEPIYRKAEYSSAADAGIEWIGAPSPTGRRVGKWTSPFFAPVYNGSNAVTLKPWSLYTVQYAVITLSSPAANGIVTFVRGQTPPTGNAVLAGSGAFAVDGSSSKLSVFQFSDTVFGIINKLVSDTAFTVEVTFTI